MRHLFSILIFCTLSWACSKKNEDIQIRNTVLNLVNSLSTADSYTPNLVFISDDYPKAKNYSSFHKFIKITTEEELRKLTNHVSPNIRCYAFHGLVERKFSGLREIFKEHVKDTSQIHLSYGGCVIIRTTVMEFMLDQLHPYGSKSSEKFSRKEYTKYKSIRLLFPTK